MEFHNAKFSYFTINIAHYAEMTLNRIVKKTMESSQGERVCTTGSEYILLEILAYFFFLPIGVKETLLSLLGPMFMLGNSW